MKQNVLLALMLLNTGLIFGMVTTSTSEEASTYRENLVALFEKCERKGKWDEAFKELSSKSSLVEDCVNNCWKSSYNGCSAKKTLSIYALELGAPDRIIELLVKRGARLTQLPLSTPPPLVVAMNRFLWNNTQPRGDKEFHPPYKVQLNPHEWFFAVSNLDTTMKKLTEAGALLDDSFYRGDGIEPLTLLDCTVEWDEPNMTTYLKDKFYTN